MSHLITGFAGEEHIQSKDQGSFNASFFGSGEYVMKAGSQFEASITSNNNVRVLDGDLLMQGRHIRIEPDIYEDINVTTGIAGTFRNDLIVMTYSKNVSTGIECAYLEIIKGTETVATPTDPAYTSGNILEGAVFNQMPLYRVRLQGVVLYSIESLFVTIPSYQALGEQYRQEFILACQTHLDSLNILDTLEEIQANTLSNQLAGALAIKQVFQSVSDGKALIASAITDKGIATNSDATFQAMANNILSIGSCTLKYHNQKNITGTGSNILSDSYAILNNRKHLIIAVGMEATLNTYYDALATDLKFKGVNVGTVFSNSPEYGGNASGRVRTHFYITDGTNGTIAFNLSATTHSTYFQRSYIELYVFEI